eukprot:COSAG02_NODE_1025_length_15146_cov_21.959460_13_plen_145_part_00
MRARAHRRRRRGGRRGARRGAYRYALRECYGSGNVAKGWTSTTLAQLDQDLAYFLLARGPYAWIGWGKWGMDWPSFSCWSQWRPCSNEIIPLPAQLTPGGLDVGEPMGICTEQDSGSGVFVRNYSKVDVQLDCGRFVAKITPKA